MTGHEWIRDQMKEEFIKGAESRDREVRELKETVLQAHEGKCWEPWQARTHSAIDKDQACEICIEIWPHKEKP